MNGTIKLKWLQGFLCNMDSFWFTVPASFFQNVKILIKGYLLYGQITPTLPFFFLNIPWTHFKFKSEKCSNILGKFLIIFLPSSV